VMPDKVLSNRLGFHCENPAEIRNRVLANHLARVELYDLEAADLPEVQQILSAHGLRAGVHCPLVMPDWYSFAPTASFLLGDAGEKLRELTFRLIIQTLQEAQKLGAKYIVVHFPKPAPEPQQQPGLKPQVDIAWDSAHRLARLAREFHTRICIEGFGERPFLSVGFLIEVLDAFPELDYCFDVGHIHLAALRGVLDYQEFLGQLAPRIGCVHLWNTRGPEDYAEFSHLPVHPTQAPNAGWVDIPWTLRTIREASPEASITFEHGIQFPPPFKLDYREGVEWVKCILDAPLQGRQHPSSATDQRLLFQQQKTQETLQ